MLEEANSFVENIDSNNATTDTIPKEKAKPVMQKSQVGEKLTSPHKMLTKKGLIFILFKFCNSCK